MWTSPPNLSKALAAGSSAFSLSDLVLELSSFLLSLQVQPSVLWLGQKVEGIFIVLCSTWSRQALLGLPPRSEHRLLQLNAALLLGPSPPGSLLGVLTIPYSLLRATARQSLDMLALPLVGL